MVRVLFFILLVNLCRAQTQMIVMSQQQKDSLLVLKKPFNDYLNSRNIDFNPIEILTDTLGSNQWVLPLSLLSDTNYLPIKNALIVGGQINNMRVRIVQPTEYKQDKMPF